jgi:hypothetical protein
MAGLCPIRTNSARQRALDRLYQYRIRIDRDPLPSAFWIEQMDFEVQLRGEGRGVSAASDVTDYITLRYVRSLAKSLRIILKVRLVVTIHAGVVEFVNRVAARFTEEKLPYDPIADRVYRCAFRPHDIDSSVPVITAHLVERIA